MIRVLLLGLLGGTCVIASMNADDPGVKISSCVVGSC